jgi:hypothetical protein
MRIRPLGVKLFHADGQTDRWTDGHDEANSLFSKFAKASENVHKVSEFRLPFWS